MLLVDNSHNMIQNSKPDYLEIFPLIQNKVDLLEFYCVQERALVY